MIALLKDFRIGIDPESTRFTVELKFGGVRIVFQAKKEMLSGLVIAINEAIEQFQVIEWSEEDG